MIDKLARTTTAVTTSVIAWVSLLSATMLKNARSTIAQNLMADVCSTVMLSMAQHVQLENATIKASVCFRALPVRLSPNRRAFVMSSIHRQEFATRYKRQELATMATSAHYTTLALMASALAKESRAMTTLNALSTRVSHLEVLA